MGSSTRMESGKNPRRAISTAQILRSCDRIDVCPAPMAMGRAEPIGTTSGKPKWYTVRPKKTQNEECNTRTFQEVTHPSTTLAQACLTVSSDGIRCISSSMIAPVMFLCRSPLKPIVVYLCGHVISYSMHRGPPSAS